MNKFKLVYAAEPLLAGNDAGASEINRMGVAVGDPLFSAAVRYRDAYLVARVTASLGGVIKIIAVVFCALVAVVFCCNGVGSHPTLTVGAISGHFGFYSHVYFGVFDCRAR